MQSAILTQWSVFLSTPSARRATGVGTVLVDAQYISIHALREEGDKVRTFFLIGSVYFYPRPPRGGRPDRTPPPAPRRVISIHALREEGDRAHRLDCTGRQRFLSTPSARRATCNHQGEPTQQAISIHALREEGDLGSVFPNDFQQISIHALREEGDAAGLPGKARPPYFYPRPPRGGRPFGC